MNRLLAGSLGMVLVLAAVAHGDEVDWKPADASRFVPPPAMKPGDLDIAPPKSPWPDADPPLTAPIFGPEPPADAPKSEPKAEPLGPPRPLGQVPARGWKPLPATPAPLRFEPAKERTFNLIADQPWAEEPAPVDPGRRFFVRGEALFWFTKLMNSPPLVTTATPPDRGVIGEPTTRILFGNGPIGDPFHAGLRVTAGLWLDDEQTCGIDSSYFFLGRSYQRFHADSTMFPVLARPIFRENLPVNPAFGPPQESGQLVAFPPGFVVPNPVPPPAVVPIPALMGSIDIAASTAMWGADVNARECLLCCAGPSAGRRIDLFAGFRVLSLADRLTIQENLLLGVGNALPAGTRVQVNDRFTTFNAFYGGQVGADAEFRRGAYFADIRCSVAVGGTAQTILIDGNQFINGVQVAAPGGLLATPANIGHHSNGEFSFVPEMRINIGANLAPGIRVFAGYDFLFWTRVVRASEQIDRSLDVTLVPNLVPPGLFLPVFPPRPAVPFTKNDFWVQGAQLGIEIRW